ncbi:MAG: hypothetical protein NTX45_04040, partial [Proteobacteria bacterium]|nr:hypothetical protein [Pseudomonadota bacterium]
GVCTVSGPSVTGVTAGTCTIAADQAGNANYNAADQATLAFTVNKANQIILCQSPPTGVVGVPVPVPCTGGNSGNPVVIRSQTPSICGISGTTDIGGVSSITVTGVALGSCTVTANQAGNANYNAAPQVTPSFNVTAGIGLTVVNANIAGGTITSDTGGVVCGATCNANLASGTLVKLTAIPNAGYQFAGWGGSCREYGNTYKLTMDAAKSCTAKFEVFKKKRRPSWRGVLSQ